MKSSEEMIILPFKSSEDFECWMAENSSSINGIWIQLFKKASGVATISYAEALDVALCYGWIDGQVKSYDEKSYIQRFTPRRSKSLWSKINRVNIERLTKAGKMREGGLKEVERAKADGRWESAYDSASTAKPPEDFLNELEKNKKAKEFYATLNKTNTYAIIWRLQTAKKFETREKRMKQILEMLEKGEKFY